MEPMDAEEMAFQNKYSRQIATMGIAAVRKLVKMKILVVGMGSVGVETSKNIILQGTRAITLFDKVFNHSISTLFCDLFLPQIIESSNPLIYSILCSEFLMIFKFIRLLLK
jgi:hypothetical protein